MDELDPSLLVETLHRLLRDRDRHALDADRDGWVAIEQVCMVVSAEMRLPVQDEQIRRLVRRARRLEVSGARIRMVRPQPWQAVPDILFHATTAAGVERVRRTGSLAISGHRKVYLSEDEGQAWRAAHRLDGPPEVLVVDTLRARRTGVRFTRGRQRGLFTASPVPVRHILNLREGYAEQWSAGGIPVRRDPDGQIRMALIRVTRRSGTTWEVAKGKLEPGESPEDAAVREVREEMGVEADMNVLRHVGDVRYGFLAPGGLPRLKTIFLYLLEPLGDMDAFSPSTREGIGDVQWFTPDDAVRAVTHSSLQPVMRVARDLVVRHALTPSADHAARRD